MENIVLYILIGLNILISMRGFSDLNFFERFLFSTVAIKRQKEFIRFVSSGFLHADWFHLGMNMFVLYSFGSNVMLAGWDKFLVIYVASLLAGNMLSYIVNSSRSEDYKAIGASGAVSGIVFASIAISPQSEIMFFLLPIAIPSWIYGIGYIAYSIFGMSKRYDNIGHEAHLGGAIAGLLVMLAYFPKLLFLEPLIIGLLLCLSLVVLFIIVFQPQVFGMAPRNTLTRAEEYSLVNEWNYLADKANRLGEHALSDREKLRMKEIDKKLKKPFF